MFGAVLALHLPAIPAVCGLMRLNLLGIEMAQTARRQEWERVEHLATMRRVPARAPLFGLAYFAAAGGGWIAWCAASGL